MQAIFAPHGMCMMWNQRLIWLHVVTDGLVALSYYSIPAALFALTFKKRDSVPVRPLVILFGLFIAFCGAGHAMDIVSIWKPIYWIKGFWNVGTALTSVVTAFVLIPQVAGFLKLPETAARLEQEKHALQEEHGILQTVLNSVSDGILLTDRAGNVLTYNPAARQLLGPGVQLASASGNGESRIGGRLVEHTVRDAGELGSVHVLRDITERRRSEEVTLRLQRVIAGMSKGFAIVALDTGRIETTNPAMNAMYRGPVEGLRAHQLFGGVESEKIATFQAIREAAEAGHFWEGETVCERRDGTLFPVLTRMNAHPGEERAILSLMQTDISLQKKMQREAEEMQNRLAQSQKLESLGVLAGGVAHDFNNLLTGVMGNASLALYAESESEVRERLNDVIAASERAADLTRQLLAYTGKGQILAGPVDVSRIARETGQFMRAAIPRNVQLRLDLAEKLPLVQGDAGQIQPILMNLVINAAEAIGDSAGVIEVRTALHRVLASDREVNQLGEPLLPGNYVCVEVVDDGCGMSEETRAHIFDPFFTTKFTGRGLGLAAVSGIVRSHGGNIQVSSEVGKGSAFRILLPAAAEKLPDQPSGAAKPDLRGEGTILVVDDEEMVRRTASVALSHYGYDVLLAENGKQAMETLSKRGGKVALVVLDTTMPVMSGAETLREIKKFLRDMPVVLTSGFSEAEALKRFPESGLSGFLQKPFTAQRLAEVVKAVIA